MQGFGKTLCPSCAHETEPDFAVCAHCGRELKTVISQAFKLVRDGQKFGIALREKIVLGQMELKEAQSTLVILNSEKSTD